MKRIDVWLALIGGATFGLLAGYYLGHNLRDDTSGKWTSDRFAANPAAFVHQENDEPSGRGSQNPDDRKKWKYATNGQGPRSITEAINEALRLPDPADEMQLLVLLESLEKEDFPLFMQALREGRSSMSLHSSKEPGSVVWAAFWRKFGEVDPQAAVMSALNCRDLKYDGRNLLEKHLFSNIGGSDPALAVSLFLEHPELPNRAKAAEGLILGWAGKDPSAALQWAEKHLDGDALSTSVYAATWVASNGISESPDIPRGLAVAQSLPEGAERASALRSLKDLIMQRSQVSAADMLEFVAASRAIGARDVTIEGTIAAKCAALDPIAAANFFTQPLPNEKLQTYPGLRQVINQWITRDAESAETWVAQQEGTPHYEVAARELTAAKNRSNDPREIQRRLDEAAIQRPR